MTSCSLIAASPVYLDSVETDGVKTWRVRVTVFWFTPPPDAEVERVVVRSEVSGCVNGREMCVLAVAIFAVAGAVPWASVAA